MFKSVSLPCGLLILFTPANLTWARDWEPAWSLITWLNRTVHVPWDILFFTITAESLAHSLSISRQTDDCIIYVICQQAKVHNLTICYHRIRKQIDVSFLCVCCVIDNEFHRNIVKVVCGSTASLIMLWRKWWSITGQTQVKPTSIILLNFLQVSAKNGIREANTMIGRWGYCTSYIGK